MSKIDFTLYLTSDGELGSGLGTELIDSLVPRDAAGNPYVPASHLKGLMRENLQEILGSCMTGVTADGLVKLLFGSGGLGGADGNSGGFYICDAKCISDEGKTNNITRTALNEWGTALDTSLRVSESIPVGTGFKGALVVHAAPNSWQEVALRLALVSVMAVGGGRNRGAGNCYVELEDASETPGALLKRLIPMLKGVDASASSMEMGSSHVLSAKTRFVKLVFRAEAPICCPETPVVGVNVLRSGFSIPASAVQGALLTKLDRVDHDLATSLYESSNFRVWPLLPVVCTKQFPARVSQTHKISKLPNESGEYDFWDLFLNEDSWHDKSSDSPLKGVDGVLLAEDEKAVKLLRSADLARVLTAHNVQNGEDDKPSNLYTVESIAPTKFVGLAAIPEDALDRLVEVFKSDNFVSLGKARTVRGGGLMELRIQPESFVPPATDEHKWQNRVFIVQSPVAIPEVLRNLGASAESILKKIVEDSNWGDVVEASASLGVIYGWNRHVKGGRQEAVAVVMPGSVFKLCEPISDNELGDKLIAGIGGMKERGYGAVLPHPGEAKEREKGRVREVLFEVSGDRSSMDGYRLWEKGKNVISASQIASLATAMTHGSKVAIEYLKCQVFERPEYIADKWKSVLETDGSGGFSGGQLYEVVNKDPEKALKALKVWQDLTVGDNAKKEGR